MSVSDMRELGNVTDTIVGGSFSRITVPIVVGLAVEVWRPRHMNRPTMEMPFFSMPVICLRMNMEQRSHKHPQTYPTQNNRVEREFLIAHGRHDGQKLA